ncbi:MAG: acetyl-CoA decarbonylase/synthase complex subunit gamma [Actinobacteria bacterium]|nr:MAG: acetyl-CoA decarbonylase/synthase complex subunit gamma [Actinomycetota bacterium]
MALSGLDIYKKLPKTNCGDCGVPTCLAFAMKLAQGQAELDTCPHVSEEAKSELMESSAPPIRSASIGLGEHAVKIGEETVMYRHEKRFENQTALALLLSDDMDDDEINKKLENITKIEFERIGLMLSADLVAIRATSDAAKFSALVEKVSKATEKGIILVSEDPAIMQAGLKVVADKKPLIYAATIDNWEKMAELAKANNCPLAIKGANLDEAADVSAKLTDAGYKELVIDSGARDIKGILADQVNSRRLALKKTFRPLGYPTIVFANEVSDDVAMQNMVASTLIAKYAGIVVLSELDAATLYPLMVERMNIFTDPQRPMTVEEGIYEVNNPTAESPVLVTTNFSLTYFILSSEVEGSRVPTWICIHDSEGLSVLTAWAAGKFVPENIAPFLKKSGIADKVNHKKLVIPGYVAQISGELEDEMGDWSVVVGPREAGDVPQFLKTWSPAGEKEESKV